MSRKLAKIPKSDDSLPPQKKFRRRKEDFICEHCGSAVTGNGYTNHCPQCLWCKHVDVNPGDRRAPCKGVMEPISITCKQGKDMILHRCTRCGFVRPNKVQEEDNAELILQLAALPGSLHEFVEG